MTRKLQGLIGVWSNIIGKIRWLAAPITQGNASDLDSQRILHHLIDEASAWSSVENSTRSENASVATAVKVGEKLRFQYKASRSVEQQVEEFGSFYELKEFEQRSDMIEDHNVTFEGTSM